MEKHFHFLFIQFFFFLPFLRILLLPFFAIFFIYILCMILLEKFVFQIKHLYIKNAFSLLENYITFLHHTQEFLIFLFFWLFCSSYFMKRKWDIKILYPFKLKILSKMMEKCCAYGDGIGCWTGIKEKLLCYYYFFFWKHVFYTFL